MSNSDLINAYFGNEMTDAERHTFESRLQKEAQLKKEFEFQKEIVDVIKQTRKAELKAMLDKVPVSGAAATSGTSKALTTAAVIGIMALGAYYFWPNDEEASTPTAVTVEQTIDEPKNDQQPQVSVTEVEPEETVESPAVIEQDEVSTPEEVVASNDIVETPVVSKEEVNASAGTPEINTPNPQTSFDTQEDLNDSLEAPGGKLVSKPGEDHATLDVEINNTHKNFTFHYQFKSGKLFLYGSFDRSLYEILEINHQEGKAMFLYYRDKFYYLSAEQSKIAPLEPVKESSLIDKLEKAREEG